MNHKGTEHTREYCRYAALALTISLFMFFVCLRWFGFGVVGILDEQEIVLHLGDFRLASFVPENGVRSEQRTVFGRTSDRQFGTKTCANQDQNKRGQGTGVERHEQ